MMWKPLVSVVVPAYSHERFVDEAVRSLIAQTYDPLEIIVVDDGSREKTFSRVEAFLPDLRQRFVRAHVARKDHVGGAANAARCLDLAQSDFIYLLDSDDVAYPQAIDRLVPLLESPDVALAVGDNKYIDERGCPYALMRHGVKYETLFAFHTADRPEFHATCDFGSYESIIGGNYVPNGWLLRRSAVRTVGGYNSEFVLDDWALLLRLAKRFRITYEGTVLADYLAHPR